MRIYGPTGPQTVSTPKSARRAASGNFTLENTETPHETSGASAPRTVGGIDALMALQGYEDLPERRRRAVKQGRRVLDALDSLKLSLLSGSLDAATLANLKVAAASLGERTGDPGLDNVLAEIELRAQVELAKAGLPEGANRKV